MIIQCICLGMVQTNCYFLQNEETKEMLIVDPGDLAPAIFRKVEAMEGKPVAVLLTHGHFDHIMACKEVAEKYGIPVLADREEEALLADPRLNLSGMSGEACALSADRLLTEGEITDVPGFSFQMLHTPGHTSGSCCYYFPEEKVLISGDTLFCRSCGRTDFPTSSYRDMMQSLKRLVTELPEDTYVYPGHEQPTTIGDEKRYNPFV